MTEPSPKISVNIAVYNTGPYLRRCLDSVCGQTLRELEIICVNDGSTDDSLEILREYAAKDSRITIINFSRNLGLPAARNAAMAIAHGEYLGFVDSDDAIDTCFYEKLYAKACETGARIVKGMRQRVFADGTRVAQPLKDKERLKKLKFAIQWTTAIYQTHFIRSNGIDCPLGARYAQDMAFLCKVVSLCSDAETVADAWYYYFERANSAVVVPFDSEATQAYLHFPEDVVSFLHSRQIDKEVYEDLFANVIIRCLLGRPLDNALPDALGDNARLCAETAIRLYATCLHPAAVDAKLAGIMPWSHRFLQAADSDGLARYLCLPREQRMMMDLRAGLRLHHV